MQIGDISLEDALVQQLVDCGRRGHEVAQAHANDPGANGFTWGTDRYQRSTQLAMDLVFPFFGFTVTRRGAGLIARRDEVELQFAVAKGPDLHNPDSFDAGSSLARRKAGRANADQDVLTGLDVPARLPGTVLHLVWSGDLHQGLTAVHIGRLVAGVDDVLDWAILERVTYPTAATGTADSTAGGDSTANEPTSYGDQPEPEVQIQRRPRPATESDGER